MRPGRGHHLGVEAEGPGGTVLWAGGPVELWGLGLVALAGTGSGSSRKTLLVFSLPGASCPAPGEPETHRNGAGTFISGEQAGARVGRQASGQGASPRPRSGSLPGCPGS